MDARFTLVGLGEALYDMIAGEPRLGGAPLNAAVHAQQLAAPHGGRGIVVSRVGQDVLGRRLIDDLERRGMSTAYIETDPDRATGKVYVDLDTDGQPTYDIVHDVAWDVLQFDPDLENLARHTDGVTFGSLAQRDAQSRNTIYRFLDACHRADRVFDVNLRLDFYDRRIVERSCELATIIKLNESELPIVQSLTGTDSPEALIRRFDLRMVALTRGERGTQLITPEGTFDGVPAELDSNEAADFVGAGDACTAAILAGRALRRDPQRIADAANAISAYVASHPGATPTLPDELLKRV